MEIGVPNYVLSYTESFNEPVDDSVVKVIVKAVAAVVTLILMIWITLWGPLDLVIGMIEYKIGYYGITIAIWLIVPAIVWGLIDEKWSAKRPEPCELRFYEEYVVHACLRRKVGRKKIQSEYYKFRYDEMEKCEIRDTSKSIMLLGMCEGEFYRHDKDGREEKKPCRKIGPSVNSSYIYMELEPSINFVKEIEEHSPIRVIPQ